MPHFEHFHHGAFSIIYNLAFIIHFAILYDIEIFTTLRRYFFRESETRLSRIFEGIDISPWCCRFIFGMLSHLSPSPPQHEAPPRPAYYMAAIPGRANAPRWPPRASRFTQSRKGRQPPKLAWSIWWGCAADFSGISPRDELIKPSSLVYWQDAFRDGECLMAIYMSTTLLFQDDLIFAQQAHKNGESEAYSFTGITGLYRYASPRHPLHETYM